LKKLYGAVFEKIKLEVNDIKHEGVLNPPGIYGRAVLLAYGVEPDFE
jgi:hypothetical protein